MPFGSYMAREKKKHNSNPYLHRCIGVFGEHMVMKSCRKKKVPKNRSLLPGAFPEGTQPSCSWVEIQEQWLQQLGTCLVTHLLQRRLQLIVLQKKLTHLSNNHKIILAAQPTWHQAGWIWVLGFCSEELPGSRTGRAERRRVRLPRHLRRKPNPNTPVLLVSTIRMTRIWLWLLWSQAEDANSLVTSSLSVTLLPLP